MSRDAGTSAPESSLPCPSWPVPTLPGSPRRSLSPGASSPALLVPPGMLGRPSNPNVPGAIGSKDRQAASQMRDQGCTDQQPRQGCGRRCLTAARDPPFCPRHEAKCRDEALVDLTHKGQTLTCFGGSVRVKL